MAYADYDFYRNEYYGDAIASEDFLKLSARASDYVRAATQGVSDRVEGWQLEAVKKASCAIGRGGNDRRRLFRGTARLQ